MLEYFQNPIKFRIRVSEDCLMKVLFQFRYYLKQNFTSSTICKSFLTNAALQSHALKTKIFLVKKLNNS